MSCLERQGRGRITAALPGSSVTEGVRSLEVRWIYPGRLDAVVAGWFGRFPAGVDSREDSYLLDPDLRGLSVKVRAGGALEVKVYGGSPGILDVPGRARGRIQSWQKWSFPFSPLRPGGGDPAGWKPVGKRRLITRFSPDSARGVAGAAGPTGSRGARWSSPRSAWAARPGGRWDSRRLAPPACFAADLRPPPSWYSRRPCPAWNSA